MWLPRLLAAWGGMKGSGEEKAGSMESRSLVPKPDRSSKSPGERFIYKSPRTILGLLAQNFWSMGTKNMYLYNLPPSPVILRLLVWFRSLDQLLGTPEF